MPSIAHDIEAGRSRRMTKEEKRVIAAASLGTMFEWYDFFLYGSLSAAIALNFFSAFPPATRNIFALLAFSVGFVVRPLGALVFGRIGDLVGRKYTFIITISLMGFSTFFVGLLPTSESIGLFAPTLLIILRLVQGLAMGGEYAGAATYVAEYAPVGRRGLYTSWIQTTATVGLFVSLLIILATRSLLGEEAFAAWGWRFPFLISIVLLGISLWIRLQLNESPVFQRLKEEGTRSKAPVAEAFGQWQNAKIGLIALFGLVIGAGVVWYTGQFYSMFFLQSVLQVDGYTTNLLVGWSLAFGTIFFVVFGWLSDYIGRKPIVMAGLLIAAVGFMPLFQLLTALANPALSRATEAVKVAVVADPADCGSLFNPIGTRTFITSCDLARDFLAKSSVRYSTKAAASGTPLSIEINAVAVPFSAETVAASRKSVIESLRAEGYPKAGDPGIVKMSDPLDVFRPQVAGIIGVLFIMVLVVTMTYGPLGACLVELFPARIRYTGMSLPSNIGFGWFGGLLPATAFAMVAQTGDIYFGLWYPIGFAALTLIVGILLLPETKDRDINADRFE